MKFTKQQIPGVYLIELERHQDERGAADGLRDEDERGIADRVRD